MSSFSARISDCGFRNPHFAIRNGLQAKPALRDVAWGSGSWLLTSVTDVDMRAFMPEQDVRLPGGELEYAVLFSVCELGAASARDVHLQVGATDGLAYTTITKVLDRLHAKGLV